MSIMARDTPYASEHARQNERNWEKGRPPRGLEQLLNWFLTAWSEEIPSALHKPGVWRDWVKLGEGGGGGSLIGSPAYNDAFRAYLEGSPKQTDALRGEDERGSVFVRPIHAALTRMGKDPDSNDAGIARFLFALAHAGGDWQTLLSSMRWATPIPFQRYVVEGVLWRLWEKYEREPEARPT